MTIEATKHLRPIRSYVQRAGRMTTAQRRALEELGPRYQVVDDIAPLDWTLLFGRAAPVVIEIGFGNGASLLAMAAAQPEKNFIGVEVHRPGIGQLLMGLAQDGITNVRLVCGDALEFLQRRVMDDSVDAVHLFFPDPWPKVRHHKRRLVQAEFAQLVRRKLRTGGYFHMATDWQPYAEHMMQTMTQAPGYTNTVGAHNYCPRPLENAPAFPVLPPSLAVAEYRPLTKFERRGQRLGHGVWDLVFQKLA